MGFVYDKEENGDFTLLNSIATWIDMFFCTSTKLAMRLGYKAISNG